MGEHHPLGASRRAARIIEVGQLVRAPGMERRRGRDLVRGGARGLAREEATGEGLLGELPEDRLDEAQARSGVGQDLGELARAQPVVQGHQDATQPGGGEVGLEEPGRILPQVGHAVPGPGSAPVPVRGPREDAAVELGVGGAPLLSRDPGDGHTLGKARTTVPEERSERGFERGPGALGFRGSSHGSSAR